MATPAKTEAAEAKKTLAAKTPEQIQVEVRCLLFCDVYLPVFRF